MRRCCRPAAMLLSMTCIWLCSLSVARAHRLGLPPSEHESVNGRFVLHVRGEHLEPCELALEDTREGAGTDLWSTPSPQGMAPVQVFITDDGRYVVLVDEWERGLGNGKVLAFIGSAGEVLASYEKQDVLTEEEVLYTSPSISRGDWSTHATFLFHANESQFVLVTQKGTIRVFDLATGRRVKPRAEEVETIRQAATARARSLLASADEDDREWGAVQAGVLGDGESIPRLKHLLNDPAVTCTTTPGTFGRESEDYGVQLAAGQALVTLMGEASAALLEPKLATDNLHMLSEWIELMGATGVAHGSPTILHLARHEEQWVRWYAIKAALESGGASVARQHREWLRDSFEYIRSQCVRALVEDPLAEDEGAFRMALDDQYAAVSYWAMRGLERLAPEDIDEVLGRLAQDKGFPDNERAALGLARRGNREALTRVVGWFDDGPPTGLALRGACEILSDHDPPGARDALRKVAAPLEDRWRKAKGTEVEEPYDYQVTRTPVRLAHVCGALVRMGDVDRLPTLRELAAEGEALYRSDAIRWLGKAGDRGSVGQLQEWSHDEERWIREAAREALKEMGIEVAPGQEAMAVPMGGQPAPTDGRQNGRILGLPPPLGAENVVLVLTLVCVLLLLRRLLGGQGGPRG